jgi:predicted RNA-binding Zn ribbon-like protein
MLIKNAVPSEALTLKTGQLSLDFANTVDWHNAPEPGERLNQYSDLVAWARQVGLLNESQARTVLVSAQHNPLAADAVLRRAITLREAIFHLLEAHVHGKAPRPADLAALNQELAASLKTAKLQTAEAGYGLAWENLGQALDGMLRPVAYSAAELLTTPELLERVGQCADDRGCGWLFLDLTKNHSRRWCDMRDCGNRAKARRHYARKKDASRAAG